MIKDHELPDILRFIDEAAERSMPATQPEVWQGRLAAGQPALAENEFPVGAAAAILAAAVTGLAGIELAVAQAENLVVKYLSEEAADGDWSKLGLESGVGNMYLHLACQTALAKTAKAVAVAVSLDSWSDSRCPVCGGAPVFACLEGEGRRTLVCGACLTRWRFKRIGCAYCGDERPEQLRVLDADGFPGWSVSVCLSCRGFLKTADMRILAAPPDWRQAAVETLPLDFAVAKWQASFLPGGNPGTGH